MVIINMPCQKIQIQKKYYWWVFKEIMNQRLSEESKCDYKKAIIDFCRFMNIDTPLVEVMVDGFLQEVFQINKKRFTNIGGIEESVHLIFDNENIKTISVKQTVQKLNELYEENEQLRQFINKGRRLSVKELMNNMNENELLKKKIKKLEKDNEELKDRLYDFEKRKIIEESEINEDVIPKIKLLRTELFGENYE